MREGKIECDSLVGIEFFYGVMDNALELDRGDGCTICTMNVPNAIELYILYWLILSISPQLKKINIILNKNIGGTNIC